MVRYKAVLIYDGTQFFGFQRQSEQSKIRTVQGEVETSLRKIGWNGRTILHAGRTDAGVHASGQVIAFDMDWKHTQERLLAALNFYLPVDIAARSIQEMNPAFHPRFDAESRIYQYRIFCHPVRHPLRERYAWRVWPELNTELLTLAASTLVGSHDFINFGRSMKPGGSTVRTVFNSKWNFEGIGGIYEIEANAFLYHMVRRIVKILADIGQGKIRSEELMRELNGKSEKILQGIAPPQGLNLTRVVYP